MRKLCYIVGAGEPTPLDFSQEGCIIACDGGLAYLQAAGIVPDYIIGDFDSLPYSPDGDNVIRLKKEKDDTDSFSAVKLGIELGYTEFLLYCCTEGRITHTFANVQLLCYLAKRGLRGSLVDNDFVYTAIENETLSLPYRNGELSVFALDERTEGVTLRGLKYPLTNHTLTNDFPLGVSNEFVTDATVTVGKGVALVVFARKKGKTGT